MTGGTSISDTRTQFDGKNGALSVNGTTSTNRPALSNGHEEGLDATKRQPRLLVWSAADQKALQRMLETYEATDMGLDDPCRLDQLAFTLASRRSQMLWRAFAIITDSEASKRGRAFSLVKPVRSSIDAGLAFVFTGQGAQYAGMGLDLIHYPPFAQTLRQVDDVYGSLGCEWSIFGKRYSVLLDQYMTNKLVRPAPPWKEHRQARIQPAHLYGCSDCSGRAS